MNGRPHCKIFLLYQGKGKIPLAAQLVVNLQDGLAEKDVASLALEACSHFAQVSRHHWVLETQIVDTAVECRLAHDLVLYKKGATLCHDLALDHTGHKRIAGEMPSAEKFIILDAVLRMCHAIRIYLYLIDKKHRLPVREVMLQFFLVHFSRFRVKYISGLIFPEGHASVMSAKAKRV